MAANTVTDREAETIEVLSARYGAARYRWLVVSACLAGAGSPGTNPGERPQAERSG